MKVPPKRKGNLNNKYDVNLGSPALNESPSEKEGKSDLIAPPAGAIRPSMKVPPKRKGNEDAEKYNELVEAPLNESPSEKEGKY